ncbi:MAG: MATE family efflux transporter [Acidimicrobiales bacterium]
MNALDRRILGLAVPALGALAVEPIYGLVDTAIVGRLGRRELGGLAVALTALNLGVYGAGFLAMVTSQRVAFRTGAGDRAGAARSAAAAYALAFGIGLLLAAIALLGARPLAEALGASGVTLDRAVTYLRFAAPGLPFQLCVLAGNGHRRGLADTRTPLRILVVANVVNVVLEVVLVYGLHLGVAGSALGTTCTQVLSGTWFLIGSARLVTAAGERWRPQVDDLVDLVRSGSVIVVRTLALLAALTMATAIAARLGDATLGGHQIATQVFFLLALALDALAVPAATFVAEALGRADPAGARLVAARCIRLSLLASVVTGGVTVLAAPLLPRLFSGDLDVRRSATVAVLICGLFQPLAALAFAFDGVLLGAGDFATLRRSMLLALGPFAVPAALTLWLRSPGIAGVWLALACWLAARAGLLGWRWRSGAWLSAGLAPGRS